MTFPIIKIIYNEVLAYFIRLWHWKRRLSWPVGKWKSEGMLGRVLKVEKKVRNSVVKIEKKTLLGRLWLFGEGKNRLLFGRLWNAVIKWKWSTATTVPSPLSFTAVCDVRLRDKSRKGTFFRTLWIYTDSSAVRHHRLQYWPMNAYGTQLSRRSVFENIFDNCFVIIGNGEFNHYHFNNCTFNFKEP